MKEVDLMESFIDRVKIVFKISKEVSTENMGKLIMDLNQSYPEKTSLDDNYFLINNEKKRGISINSERITFDFSLLKGSFSDDEVQGVIDVFKANGLFDDDILNLSFNFRYFLQPDGDDNTINFTSGLLKLIEKENDGTLRAFSFDKNVQDNIHNISCAIRTDKQEAAITIGCRMKNASYDKVVELLRDKKIWSDTFVKNQTVIQ